MPVTPVAAVTRLRSAPSDVPRLSRERVPVLVERIARTAAGDGGGCR